MAAVLARSASDLHVVAVQYAGAAIGWLLLLLGFGLIFDGVSAIWARAGRAGNLTSHRQ